MYLIHSAGGSIKNRFTQTVSHYVHDPNSCHLWHSQPNPFSQNATDKWSQNGPDKDDASVKSALDTTTEEAILLFSSLQCSCYSQKRLICAVMTTALKSIPKFRVLPPSWREVQKLTENYAFSAHYLQILLSLQITLRSVKMPTLQLTLQSPLQSCSSCTRLVSARTQTSMKLGKTYPAIFWTCCWAVQKHH